MQASALFPVFAVLERQTKGAYVGSIDARCAPLTVSFTESRLAVLRGLVSGIVSAMSVPDGALHPGKVIATNEKVPFLCIMFQTRSLYPVGVQQEGSRGVHAVR